MDTKKILREANKLRDLENYDEAIELYNSLLDNGGYDRLELLFQLGGCCFFNKEYSNALKCFKECIEIDPNAEDASLGLYLTYSELDRLEEGLLEMKRFLDGHPPKLYNDTINELVEGLERGYATNFREIILELSKKRNLIENILQSNLLQNFT